MHFCRSKHWVHPWVQLSNSVVRSPHASEDALIMTIFCEQNVVILKFSTLKRSDILFFSFFWALISIKEWISLSFPPFILSLLCIVIPGEVLYSEKSCNTFQQRQKNNSICTVRIICSLKMICCTALQFCHVNQKCLSENYESVFYV